MNRRAFLRAGGLVAAGAAVTGSASAVHAETGGSNNDRAFAGVGESAGDTPAAATSTKVIYRVETDRKLIALTLDDGPMPAYTNDYLAMLSESRVRATFCLVGTHVLANPDIVKRQVALGHQLENHSYSHADLGRASAAVAASEVRRGMEIVEQASGRRPDYFRPPRGMLSGAAIAAAGRAQADILMWSLQLHEKIMGVDESVAHVVDNIVPGTILLAHDARHRTLDRRIGLHALPRIIATLRARGYEFVTVTELVAAGAAAK